MQDMQYAFAKKSYNPKFVSRVIYDDNDGQKSQNHIFWWQIWGMFFAALW